MPLTLQIVSGAYAGKRIVLRDGQLATFGRTAWSDFHFPADAAFGDVHFRIEQRGTQWIVLDLQSGRGTWLNDESVERATLQTGSILRAGTTGFRIVVGDESRAVRDAETSAGTPVGDREPPPVVAPLAEWLAAHADVFLSPPAVEDALAASSGESFAASLRAREAWPDLWRFLANYLPLPAAVAWGCQVVRSVQRTTAIPWAAKDEQALVAAEAWVKSGEETARNHAAECAESLAHETACAWLAAAAGWSGGSLAPPSAGPVPPPPRLPRTAVEVAVTLALGQLSAAQQEAGRADAAELASEGLKS